MANFIDTHAQEGQTWRQLCGTVEPQLDSSGLLVGPWGAAIRAAVAYELQGRAGEFSGGPAGQVIDFLNELGHNPYMDAATKTEETAKSTPSQPQTMQIPDLGDVRCKEPGAPSGVKIAVGIKTNRFYHSSRAVAAWNGWASQYGHGVTFATDGKFNEAAHWPASVVVVRDNVDVKRRSPYVPPWRDSSVNASKIDPSSLPQLTRRLAVLLTTMYTCWGHSAEWYLLTDDDTFVRTDMIGPMLRKYRHQDMHLLGSPVMSDHRFVTKNHRMLYGDSLHCGGPHVLLSAALATQFLPTTVTCLTGTPRTWLPTYWDEVELLGRCLYERVRVNCTLPLTDDVADGETDFGFFAQCTKKTNKELDDYVRVTLKGDWRRLQIGGFHPVEADDMMTFHDRFHLPNIETISGTLAREL